MVTPGPHSLCGAVDDRTSVLFCHIESVNKAIVGRSGFTHVRNKLNSTLGLFRIIRIWCTFDNTLSVHCLTRPWDDKTMRHATTVQ